MANSMRARVAVVALTVATAYAFAGCAESGDSTESPPTRSAFPITATGLVSSVGAGPDGALYFTDTDISDDGDFRCSGTSGLNTTRLSVLGDGDSAPQQILESRQTLRGLTVAGDGSVLVANTDADSLERIPVQEITDRNGSAEATEVVTDSPVQPWYLSTDADGNIYFVDWNDSQAKRVAHGSSAVDDLRDVRHTEALSAGADGSVYALVDTEGGVDVVAVEGTTAVTPPVVAGIQQSNDVRDFEVAPNGDVYLLECFQNGGPETTRASVLRVPQGQTAPVRLEGFDNPVDIEIAGGMLYVADGNKIVAQSIDQP